MLGSSSPGGVTAVPLVCKGSEENAVGSFDGGRYDANYFLGVDASGRLAADFEEQWQRGQPRSESPIDRDDGHSHRGMAPRCSDL